MGLRARRVGAYLVVGVVFALCPLLGAPARSDSGIRVTALDGDAHAGGEALDIHHEVSPGEPIETGDEGRCSVLLADAAILQFCSRTGLRVGEPGEQGASVVQLDRGELKATVGPRPAGDPLEIHTPAAIATILGTVVHVEVDPETGDTVISSLESRVQVKSSNPLATGTVIIEAGEQVTIRRGESPESKRRFDRRRLASAASCTFDDDFHRAAVRAQRASRMHAVTTGIASEDIPTEALPAVGAGRESGLASLVSARPVPGEDKTIVRSDCLPTTCGLSTAIADALLDLCLGDPGEHCSFP